LVLVILAVIWAAVLLPPFLQNRSESRPADSISTFRSQLSVLERHSVGAGRTSPADRPASGPTVRPTVRPVARPVRGGVDPARLARTAAKKRRRDVLVTLLASAGITLVLTLVLPQVLFFHLAIDVLLAGYVFLLVQRRKLAEERATKVRYMAPVQARRHATVPVRSEQPALRPAAFN
jgi:hypothetical protein